MTYTLFDKQHLTKFIISALLFFYSFSCFALEVPIYDFPITAYSQNTNDYLSPEAADYNKPVLSPGYQRKQLKRFYNHYYSSDNQGLSPWSEHMVVAILPMVKKVEPKILNGFSNQNKPNEGKHYAENFKVHDQIWWNKIRENMDFHALASSEFKEENRAISVANTHARVLPDAAPDFFHVSLPGQGFPFDNLQESAIWAGTPLYVFSVSKDKMWSLVLTPDGYYAWVKSNDIAYVSPKFIRQWQTAAQYGLIAITQTETSIVDDQGQFQFTGYIGSVFPMIGQNDPHTSILIPFKGENNQAIIKIGTINTNASRIMPVPLSPKNLVSIINQLKDRPYGWGGSFFFNDCSQELKSIFTPFGIWIPRNAVQQAQLNSTLDLSKNNVDERIALLKEKGHPLMTIIYVDGHDMLYIGNKNVNNNAVIITYQNVWGMSSKNRDKRYVIGQSLFLPLLKYYPENSDVISLADNPTFKLIYLDELNTKVESPQEFVNQYFSYL